MTFIIYNKIYNIMQHFIAIYICYYVVILYEEVYTSTLKY